MTCLTFQKAWAAGTPHSPALVAAGPTPRSWTVWWHPKTISEHFEPLRWVFFFVPHPSLASLFFFSFFLKFLLEVTKKKRYLLAKKLVLLRPRNEKHWTDGHRESEGSGVPSLERRLGPDHPDCRQGPPGGREAACIGHSNRLSLRQVPGWNFSSAHPGHDWAEGCPDSTKQPERCPEIRRTKGRSLGWAGLRPREMGWEGLGETLHPHPLQPTPPVYLGAGQESYWLPLHHPRLWAEGGWGGRRPGVGNHPLPNPSRWGSAGAGGGGVRVYFVFLDVEGDPQPRP